MSRIRSFRRGRIGPALAALAAGAFLAPAAEAQTSVEEISIVAGLDGRISEWFFLIEVQGMNLTSVSVMPPSGGPLVLDGSGGFEFEFEAGPFASFAALKAAHPSGSYVFTVDGSHMVTLSWNPAEPVGSGGLPSLVIDSPAHGTADVSTTPDVAFTIDCTNCDDLNLELENLSGMAASFGFGELDVMSFTNPIPFAAMMSEGPEIELALGLAEVELLSGLVNFSDESFDAPSGLGSFEYIEAGLLFASSTFTVPEPAGTTPALAALVALGLLHRRRRSILSG
jgi:MYXO-CTERM domain-containing protein